MEPQNHRFRDFSEWLSQYPHLLNDQPQETQKSEHILARCQSTNTSEKGRTVFAPENFRIRQIVR